MAGNTPVLVTAEQATRILGTDPEALKRWKRSGALVTVGDFAPKGGRFEPLYRSRDILRLTEEG